MYLQSRSSQWIVLHLRARFCWGAGIVQRLRRNLASLRANTDSDVAAPFMVLPAEALLHE